MKPQSAKISKKPARMLVAEWAPRFVELPVRIVSEANMRGNWTAGHGRGKRQRKLVGPCLARWSARRPHLPCVVQLTRVAPRELDGDNLQRAFKAVRDEVAKWLGVDDRDPRVFWAYAQVSRKPAVHGIRIAWREVLPAEIERLRGAIEGSSDSWTL